jgi:hypothetical protein
MRAKSILAKVSGTDLDQEIASLRSRCAAAADGSPLQRSLQGSLDIALKRRGNLDRASESVQVVEAELDRIEKQFALLHEESQVSSDPALITSRLDTVMDSLQTTSRWLTEHRDLLGTVEEPPPAVALSPDPLRAKG